MSNAARQFAAAGQFGGTASYEPRSLVELNTPLLAKSIAKEEAAIAATEQAEREAAAMRQAAEGAAKLDAAVELFEGLALPEVAELGIDVKGLPPARARLARLLAWGNKLQQQLGDLADGRAKFIAKLGVPAITQKALDDLIAADKTGLLAWMQRGGAGSQPAVREFERAKLAEKLIGDTHEAKTARDAISAADFEIDCLTREVAVLHDRRTEFANAALIEHAAETGRQYQAAVDETTNQLAALLGLASFAGGHGDGSKFFHSYGSGTFELDLPRFGLPTVDGSDPAAANHTRKFRPRVAVDAHMVKAAAKPWLELRERWLLDPRADLVVPDEPEPTE